MASPMPPTPFFEALMLRCLIFRFRDPFSTILGSFGEPIGAKIDLGASCGTLGPPKGLLEIPRVPFWWSLGSFWSFWNHFGSFSPYHPLR